MQEFEQVLLIFLVAVLLAAAARRVGAPYPAFLALGGALLAFVPGVPRLSLPPELVLALFVAPVLLDAAFDASLRDLRDNWAPVAGLVLVAVGLTTAAVAFVAHALVPTMRGLLRLHSALSWRLPMRLRRRRCCVRFIRRSAS
jgi:monovalent cation/hydrogen antiporter